MCVSRLDVQNFCCYHSLQIRLQYVAVCSSFHLVSVRVPCAVVVFVQSFDYKGELIMFV